MSGTSVPHLILFPLLPYSHPVPHVVGGPAVSSRGVGRGRETTLLSSRPPVVHLPGDGPFPSLNPESFPRSLVHTVLVNRPHPLRGNNFTSKERWWGRGPGLSVLQTPTFHCRDENDSRDPLRISEKSVSWGRAVRLPSSLTQFTLKNKSASGHRNPGPVDLDSRLWREGPDVLLRPWGPV